MHPHIAISTAPVLQTRVDDASTPACQRPNSMLQPQEKHFMAPYEIDGVAVCGAGPFSLTAACLLRQRCDSVTFIDSSTRKQLNGDSTDQHSFNVTVVQQSMAILAIIGFVDDDMAIALSTRQFSNKNRGSVHRYGLRENDRLYFIPRCSLVRRLFQRAANLELLFLESPRSVSLEAGRGFLLTMSSDNTVEPLKAKSMQVADGVSSRSREVITGNAHTSYQQSVFAPAFPGESARQCMLAATPAVHVASKEVV
jgi:2-polyprenyl-6-methoxyphenol hydroxylase-like FAD-dependent oxidoreductase